MSSTTSSHKHILDEMRNDLSKDEFIKLTNKLNSSIISNNSSLSDIINSSDIMDLEIDNTISNIGNKNRDLR